MCDNKKRSEHTKLLYKFPTGGGERKRQGEQYRGEVYHNCPFRVFKGTLWCIHALDLQK